MANIKPRKRGRAPNTNETNKVKEAAASPSPRKVPSDQPVGALRKYISRYDLHIDTPMTLEGFMLRGKVGQHSESGKQSRRSAYGEASRAVQDHLREGVIKEGDAIAEFLYAVSNRKSEFKLQFGDNGKHASQPGSSLQKKDDVEKPGGE